MDALALLAVVHRRKRLATLLHSHHLLQILLGPTMAVLTYGGNLTVKSGSWRMMMTALCQTTMSPCHRRRMRMKMLVFLRPLRHTGSFGRLKGKAVARVEKEKGQAINATLLIRLRKFLVAGLGKNGWHEPLAPLAAAGGIGTAVQKASPEKEKEKARAR